MPLAVLLARQGVLLTFVSVAAWAVFLALAAVVSRQDFRENIIAHRSLRYGAMFIMVCYFFLFIATLLGSHGQLAFYYQWTYYRELLLHVSTTAAVGLGLWYIGVWPAGDTKLFILLALLFPLMRVAGSFYEGKTFLVVLINIFLPAAAGVTLQSFYWLWQTRLRHRIHFMNQLGWSRGFSFVSSQIGSATSIGKGRDLIGVALSDPWGASKNLIRWLGSIAAMSIVSCLIQKVIPSPLARTMCCFLLFFVWRWVSDMPMRWLMRVVVVVALAALWRASGSSFSSVRQAFGEITAFSLAVNLGMYWMRSVITGQWSGLASMAVLGLAFFLPSLLSGYVSWGPKLFLWGATGGMFGLSYMMIRVWEVESHPNLRPEQLKAYMVLHREFTAQLKTDESFFEEHFERSYADGLTSEQVEALREWCRQKSIEFVPLAQTISFAPWIFSGYFITWLLNGHVLQGLY